MQTDLERGEYVDRVEKGKWCPLLLLSDGRVRFVNREGTKTDPVFNCLQERCALYDEDFKRCGLINRQ